MTDHELLHDYADSGSETAFGELVRRYVSLVHSAAQRQVRDPHLAEEITQAVFVVLARKAGRLGADTVLAGWLLKATSYTAQVQIRANVRRAQREQEATMQSTLNESTDAAWEHLAPHLDAAMSALGDDDRNAIALRYFENKTAAEIAAALKVNEEAAQKRVARALEKLRKIFSKRGVTLSAVAIAGAVVANSVQAAPVALAKTVTAVAIVKGAAASASTLTLIKGALKIIAWSKAKTAIMVSAALILAAGTTTVIVKSSSHHPQVKLQWTPAEKESYQQDSISRMHQGWQRGRAASLFVADHGNMLPRNFKQMKTYVRNLSASNWEIVSGGNLSDITKPAQTILFKEKEAQPSPDGKFAKVYVFVDGHGVMVSSPDYEFAAVEQQEGFLIRLAKN